MPKDSFSVVIACTHDADALIATLQSLREIDYPPGFDVIVIDDGSRQGRQSALAANSDGLDVRYTEAPGISRAAAWNFASQESAAEYVAFLEDGCMPSPDWLMVYKNAFEVWNIGVIGGQDLPPKNASFLDRSLHYVLTSFVGSLCMRTGAGYAGRYYPRPRNMAARRESVRLAGGFSDRYPECPEVPLIDRMARIGYKSAYAHQAWVRHHQEAGIFEFLCRSFLLGRRRGLGTMQAEVRRVYSTAFALMVIPGLLALYSGTHELGIRMLALMAGAYVLAVGLSTLHSVVVLRTPLALIAVPLLMILHHGAHMAGYVAGLSGGLRLKRRPRC
jgi:GT2 family glycosyltransferase